MDASNLIKTWLTAIILFVIYLLVYLVCDSQIMIWSRVLSEMLPKFDNLNDFIMNIWVFSPFIVCSLIVGWAVFASMSTEFDSDFGEFDTGRGGF